MNVRRNHQKTVKTIEIETAPAELTKYTHASLSPETAQSLAADIAELTAAGFPVLYASGERGTVPTSYRSAYRMHAPHWRYDGRTIHATSAKLETRPRGASIPANFTVQGDAAPAGWRIGKRHDDGTLTIRRK